MHQASSLTFCMNSEINHVDGKRSDFFFFFLVTIHSSETCIKKPRVCRVFNFTALKANHCLPSVRPWHLTSMSLVNKRQERKKAQRAGTRQSCSFMAEYIYFNKNQTHEERSHQRQHGHVNWPTRLVKGQNTGRLKYLNNKNHHTVLNIHSFPFTFALVVFLNKVWLT